MMVTSLPEKKSTDDVLEVRLKKRSWSADRWSPKHCRGTVGDLRIYLAELHAMLERLELLELVAVDLVIFLGNCSGKVRADKEQAKVNLRLLPDTFLRNGPLIVVMSSQAGSLLELHFVVGTLV